MLLQGVVVVRLDNISLEHEMGQDDPLSKHVQVIPHFPFCVAVRIHAQLSPSGINEDSEQHPHIILQIGRRQGFLSAVRPVGGEARGYGVVAALFPGPRACRRCSRWQQQVSSS